MTSQTKTSPPPTGTTFTPDHRELATDSRFTKLAEELQKIGPINSATTFNRYCRLACQLWSDHFPRGLGNVTSKFTEDYGLIACGAQNTIRTGWGGVVITRHEHPLVEKFLVVRAGGYLALETHEQKDERLVVREGTGLILYRSGAARTLAVQSLFPGESFHFPPGVEHCIIGTENLLVFERSSDPKGMDQDLVFLYEPDALA